jgi:hypothetical protein
VASLLTPNILVTKDLMNIAQILVHVVFAGSGYDLQWSGYQVF